MSAAATTVYYYCCAGDLSQSPAHRFGVVGNPSNRASPTQHEDVHILHVKLQYHIHMAVPAHVRLTLS